MAAAGQSFQVVHLDLSERKVMRILFFIGDWFLFMGVIQGYDYHVFWLKTLDFFFFVLLILVSYDELCAGEV
ncbi:MAG: hypothetical protein HYY51_02850 [Candidatus Magasanikbacteria bacterium]|nr:hypothetical protein [Candidatus Magasanikbacteria bacterium]